MYFDNRPIRNCGVGGGDPALKYKIPISPSPYLRSIRRIGIARQSRAPGRLAANLGGVVCSSIDHHTGLGAAIGRRIAIKEGVGRNFLYSGRNAALAQLLYFDFMGKLNVPLNRSDVSCEIDLELVASEVAPIDIRNAARWQEIPTSPLASHRGTSPMAQIYNLDGYPVSRCL